MWGAHAAGADRLRSKDPQRLLLCHYNLRFHALLLVLLQLLLATLVNPVILDHWWLALIRDLHSQVIVHDWLDDLRRRAVEESHLCTLHLTLLVLFFDQLDLRDAHNDHIAHWLRRRSELRKELRGAPFG